jgi:hypothetical protein
MTRHRRQREQAVIASRPVGLCPLERASGHGRDFDV